MIAALFISEDASSGNRKGVKRVLTVRNGGPFAKNRVTLRAAYGLCQITQCVLLGRTVGGRCAARTFKSWLAMGINLFYQPWLSRL